MDAVLARLEAPGSRTRRAPKLGQNIKYDTHVLQQRRPDQVRGYVHDTMLRELRARGRTSRTGWKAWRSDTWGAAG